MSEPMHAALLRRLDQLERDNRRWKLVAGTAVAMLGMLVLLGAAGREHATGDDTTPVYYVGNRYMAERGTDTGQLSQLGYLAGVLDAFSVHAWLAPGTDLAGSVRQCIRSRYRRGIQLGQAHAIVEHYLLAHPQKWDLSMPALIGGTFSEVCH